jgi:lipid II:glycine glycyltransferase (peptidoglycan interpeptide bridge formation enzyme)
MFKTNLKIEKVIVKDAENAVLVVSILTKKLNFVWFIIIVLGFVTKNFH